MRHYATFSRKYYQSHHIRCVRPSSYRGNRICNSSQGVCYLDYTRRYYIWNHFFIAAEPRSITKSAAFPPLVGCLVRPSWSGFPPCHAATLPPLFSEKNDLELGQDFFLPLSKGSIEYVRHRFFPFFPPHVECRCPTSPIAFLS